MKDWMLLLETSGRAAAVALSRNSRLVAAQKLDESRRHNRDLVPASSELLQQAGIRPSDLCRIVVGLGPGSFTGLRVGLITAKTVAHALGIPLVPVPTFATLAAAVPNDVPVVDVIADALQGQIYQQRFGSLDSRGVRPELSELKIGSFAEWLDAGQATCVAGPGVLVYRDRLAAFRISPDTWSAPDPVHLLRVAENTPAVVGEPMLALEPLYLRGSSAEEKARRGGQS